VSIQETSYNDYLLGKEMVRDNKDSIEGLVKSGNLTDFF
jgi:hypothetical protein